MVFYGGVLRSSVCVDIVSLAGGAGALQCDCVGSLYGRRGLNGHRGPMTETTLVMWWSLGVLASMW
jgi:hypothetical protein